MTTNENSMEFRLHTILCKLSGIPFPYLKLMSIQILEILILSFLLQSIFVQEVSHHDISNILDCKIYCRQIFREVVLIDNVLF